MYKNIIKYISYIKDTFIEIKNLKISISKIFIIHLLNNFN